MNFSLILRIQGLSNYFHPVMSRRLLIETLLSRIESMFTEINVPEPALGATVSAAVSALVDTL